MLKQLYERFQHWSDGGAIYILSDTHFEDSDCKLMDNNWISPEEQIKMINRVVGKTDTLVLLGDLGNPEWIKKIRARRKILITGNHDAVSQYEGLFDEIYNGPLFISNRLLLSHEPIDGLTFCLNVHGHDHAGIMYYSDQFGAKHVNVASNVCDYIPLNLAKLIKSGVMKNIKDIHRQTIDNANIRPIERKQ